MRIVVWMLGLVILAVAAYAIRRAYAQWTERSRASEARMASLLAEMKGSVPAAVKEAPEERLLFDAAAKSAQAGEPVLAIQLYARLLSRYPQSALAGPARTAVAEQKTKLAKV